MEIQPIIRFEIKAEIQKNQQRIDLSEGRINGQNMLFPTLFCT
jgi:hypothetical protein